MMHSYLLLQSLLFVFLFHKDRIFLGLQSPISWLLKTDALEICKLISSCTAV